MNYERKSCEGISFLFFLFACLGNITYVISIVVVSSGRKYLLINLPWLIGSLGTLGEDFVIFFQFFHYRDNSKSLEEEIIDDDEALSEQEVSEEGGIAAVRTYGTA